MTGTPAASRWIGTGVAVGTGAAVAGTGVARNGGVVDSGAVCNVATGAAGVPQAPASALKSASTIEQSRNVGEPRVAVNCTRQAPSRGVCASRDIGSFVDDRVQLKACIKKD